MGDDKISNNEAIDAALHLDGDPEKVREFYDDWASQYDSDTADSEYMGPAFAAKLFTDIDRSEKPDNLDCQILDAGCGTGFVGVALSAHRYQNIDGFDLSEVMAKKAADSGCYREVKGNIDMMLATQSYPTQSYDAVLSIGVFTLGHVPPEALLVLIELVKPGGILLVSTRSHYYDQSNFQEVVDRLIANTDLKLLRLIKNAPYNNDGDAHYWVFQH